MKPFKYILILVTVYNLLLTTAQAQFTAANVTESNTGTSATGVVNTGCDIMEYSGSSELFVAVWDSDNTNSEIFYDDGTNSGRVSLNKPNGQDPDVALISDGTNYFAVVAYYTTSIGSPVAYVAEFYRYLNGALTYVSNSNTTLLNNISIGSSINVDGNRNGDFIIVFTKDSSNLKVPVCITGYMNSGQPTFYFTTPVTLRTTGISASHLYSDVCIWDSTTVGTDVVYIAYYNNTNIIIQEERWQNLDQASPTINTTDFASFNPTSIGTISALRIACVNLSASRYNMTVAYSDGNDVGAWTWADGSGAAQNIFTDNSYQSGPINAARNINPVVTYDGTGQNNIYIAWIYDNTGPAYSGAAYHPNDILPVGVVCQVDGTPTSTTYLDIPRNVDPDEKAISICGRHSDSNNNIGVAWFDRINSGTHDVRYKSVAATPLNSYRLHLTVSNPDDVITIQILDMQGRLVLTLDNKIENLNQYLKTLNLQAGMYIIRTISSQNQISNIYYVN